MKRTPILQALLIFACTTGMQATAAETNQKSIHIEPQSLVAALQQFSEQTGIQVGYQSELAQGIQSKITVATKKPSQALDQLLAGTGLRYRFINDNTVVLQATATIEGNSQAPLALAQADTSVDWTSDRSGAQGHVLEEIIVTASKRETSLQDTAISITALSDDTIEKRNLVQMSDYLSSIPGVSMQDRGAGQNTITIRGIGDGSQVDLNSTVGVYFGEVPVTSLGSAGNANQAGNADLRLVDIERIEVLRGPQGTLFGAQSLGGTVRVIPKSPNLAEVEGKVAGLVSQTGEKGGTNSMVQGVINLPVIEDKLAIRGVGYRFVDSGYVENVAASSPSPQLQASIAAGGVAKDQNDIGRDETTGFRLSALWQPIDPLAITLGYVHQETETKGWPEVNLNLPGDFQQARIQVANGSDYESLENEIDIVNLMVEYDFGWGSLVNSTAWVDHLALAEFDLSFVDLSCCLGGTAFSPYVSSNRQSQDLLVEELRFVSQFDGPLQVLAGLYYEDKQLERNGSTAHWSGALPVPPTASVIVFNNPIVNTKQKALFGEISYQLTDEITATAGARYFDYDQENVLPWANTVQRNDDDGKTLKFNLSYELNDHTLLFFQWAEGFRLGKYQDLPLAANDADSDGLYEFTDGSERAVSNQVAPDAVENFELGIKGSFLDNRITFSATAFRIDWQGIPVSLTTVATFEVALFNVGESKSEGIELEVQARLRDNLIVDFAGSYNKAVLTKDSPLGQSGDNLPGSADTNLRAGLEYQFDLAGYPGFARVDYTYVGEYYNNFSETGLAAGDYSQIYLKTGVSLDQIAVDLFVKNLTNVDDLTWVESFFGAGRAYRLRPRTIGLNVSYEF